MTLGQALAAKVRLIVWCKRCGHRADLTVAERAHHIAEWIRLSEEEQEQSAQLAPKGHIGHRPEGGINAAARDLGIERTEAQRAVKIDGLDPEAKAPGGRCRVSRPEPARRLSHIAAASRIDQTTSRLTPADISGAGA